MKSVVLGMLMIMAGMVGALVVLGDRPEQTAARVFVPEAAALNTLQ